MTIKPRISVWRKVLLASVASTGLIFSNHAFAADTQIAPISVTTIEQFHVGRDQQDFGAFRFVGGLSMVSPNRDFGALSSIRFLDAGNQFVAVADTGFLVRGAIVRNDAGVPDAVSDLAISPLPDSNGNISAKKWEVDAESLDIQGDRITIGYERVHRLSEFTLTAEGLSDEKRTLDFLVPRAELRGNRGFEMMASAPAQSALQGARIAITEKSIDKNGNIFGAIVEGPKRGIFTVLRRDDFDITDGDFLPNGDLLLLERSYKITSGVKMRIRLIKAADIEQGAIIDGPIVLEADMRFQIDNMEGLDVFTAADGSTRIGLVSDDNKSILQRNLYLEFIVDETAL